MSENLQYQCYLEEIQIAAMYTNVIKETPNIQPLDDFPGKKDLG